MKFLISFFYIDGEKAKSKWAVQSAPLKGSWEPPKIWATPDRRPKISWALRHFRAPTCKYEYNNLDKTSKETPSYPVLEEFDDEDKGTRNFFNSKKSGTYDRCCGQKKSNKKKYDEDCNQWVNSRVRFTTSEIGYLYNFTFNETTGLPEGM